MFQIRTVAELEALSAKVKWQYFEKLVAFIFEENGFDVEQNVIVAAGGTKRQFDVVARRFGETLLVECKKRKGVSKADIANHAERCEFYCRAKKCGAAPLVVTLNGVTQLRSRAAGEMPVVPIMMLNAFLNREELEA